MGIFFFSLKNSRSNLVPAVRGISPHAGKTAQCINKYILPPTSYLNSIQQPFIPLPKKKKHLFFPPNKTHICVASFKIHIVMLF